MSPTPDSTLADLRQTIADLQRANAELKRQLAERTAERDEASRRLDERTVERDEALDREAATAEVLGVINASPGDLKPVFEAMLEKAISLCEASFGILWTYDGEYMHASAITGVPPQFAEFLKQGPHRPARTMQQALLSGEPFGQIADLTKTEGYQSGETLPRAGADLGGVRTLLGVTLRKDDAVLGVFGIYRQEVRPFTDKQIALLQNFAAQAVIAMENARLITETREALEQQTATAEVLGVINSSPGDLVPVFDAMLEKATRLCEAPFGILRTWDGERFHFGAVHGDPRFSDWVRQRGPFRPTRDESLLGRILAGERVVHFSDAAGDEGYRTDTGFRKMVEASGIRSAITVALHKDDALLGTITVYRREVRPFTDKQIALLQSFAAQAVIAIENARLITETREALEQQTATAEVLGVINSSPGDLAPVFDAMLEKAMRLCDAAFGMLSIYDGEQFHPAALRGVPSAVVDLLHQPGKARPGGALLRLVHGETIVHIGDITADEAYRSGNPGRRALADVGGARTTVWVALRKDDSLLGVIAMYRREVRPFAEKEIALIENFAAQAVIAIENARLITETREALEQQTATSEVLGVINSSPGDLAPVFDAMLEKAMNLCGAAFGVLRTYDGDRYHTAATRGVPPAYAEFLTSNPERPEKGTMGGRILEGEPLVHVADAMAEGIYATGLTHRRALVDLGGARTVLVMPLKKDRAVLGAIQIYRREVRPFTDKQIALLQNFAAQAVIAMENARLLGELRQRTDEVAELNRGLEARVAAQVDELGRVGRLKRFLAPQLAELIVSHGDEKILESHRCEIVVVFCDLRGYTAFTETAEPEEVLDFLRQYHGALGPLVSQFEGTLDQFSGDGIMVFFNDPVPCPDPAERAVKMAVAMRSAANTLIADWRERGRDLGFGAGIAQGYATLGQIGFSERSGYTAIGTVCNVAARLCAEAKDGQILLGQLVNVALKGSVATEQLGPLALKGLSQPVVAYNVPLGAIQPALRVIEGGPQSV